MSPTFEEVENLFFLYSFLQFTAHLPLFLFDSIALVQVMCLLSPLAKSKKQIDILETAVSLFRRALCASMTYVYIQGG